MKVRSTRQHLTCLHATNPQRKADTQIMTVSPFDRQHGVGNQQEDTKRENGDADPTRGMNCISQVYCNRVRIWKQTRKAQNLPESYLHSARGHGKQQDKVLLPRVTCWQ
jgi:hypothetical protein